MAFEDLLTSIQDEGERTQLLALATKYPNLRTIAETGQKFAPVIEELNRRGVAPDAEIAALPNWIDWRNNNWDGVAKATKAQLEERARAEAAELKLTELQAKGQTDMTYDELKAKLAAEGLVVKPDELKNVVTREELNADRLAQAKRFQEVYADLTPRLNEFRQKYGTELPAKDVFDFMERNPRFNTTTQKFEMPSVEEAYKAVAAPKEREAEIASLKREKEEAKAAGIEEGRRLAMQSVEGRGMPVSAGSQRASTSFMSKIFGSRAARAGAAAGGRLGDGTAAREMMADMNKRQMAGGQV